MLTDEVKWLAKYLSVDCIPNFGMDEMLEVFMIEFRQRLLNNLAGIPTLVINCRQSRDAPSSLTL